MIFSAIKQTITKIFRRLFYAIIEKSVYQRARSTSQTKYFPICDGKNFIYKPLSLGDDSRTLHAKFFQESTINPLAIDFGRYPCEIISGTLIPPESKWSGEILAPAVVPVSVSASDKVNRRGDFAVNVTLNDESHVLGGLTAEQFYYVPIHEPGTLSIQSDQAMVVGDPLFYQLPKKNNRRLVLIVFVDSFATQILNCINVEQDLPNIQRFFSQGTVFDRCYSTSEWTMPSLPSIVSGLRTRRHGIFHPNKTPIVGNGYPILSEQFQNQGYLTFNLSTAPRNTPYHGYGKGFDRTVYKLNHAMENCVSLALDQLRAFPHRDHYIWLDVMDVHNAPKALPSISIQTGLSLKGMDFEKTPVAWKCEKNEPSIERYIGHLKRTDFYLGTLFQHIEENYSDDEILVALIADHGIGFLNDSPYLLNPAMTNVAMMLRGGGVPVSRSDEIVQTIDLCPSLLHLAGLEPMTDIDGQLPVAFGGSAARDVAISESVYPNRPYQAFVTDGEYEYFLMSEGLVDDEGAFITGTPHEALHFRGNYDHEVSADQFEKSRDFRKTLDSILD